VRSWLRKVSKNLGDIITSTKTTGNKQPNLVPVVKPVEIITPPTILTPQVPVITTTAKPVPITTTTTTTTTTKPKPTTTTTTKPKPTTTTTRTTLPPTTKRADPAEIVS